MQDFLYALTSGESATLTWQGVIETILAATVIGFIISLVYLFTHKKEGYSQAFCVALILLAPIVGMVILVIGNNVATAFSLAGAFALVRFRSAPGDPKDIAYVFMSVTMGLTCGLGYWIWAALATVILCIIILVLHFTNFAGKKGASYVLKITVPETLNYVGAFDECLGKYCKTFKMSRVKSVDFGALFEISFDINMKNPEQIREMIDDLRAMNGNLKIMLSTPETVNKSFHFQ
ncbi:MAG: DUF4956 domain-containing protein [Eubacteriales bacterium]|nr:DUF4956 domain-containing protein [Eubacteriales bacterium]